MRTLVLLRHGKSGYPVGVPDHERPLAPRGQQQATLAGQWLRAEGFAPDAVICSTATRTRETLACTGFAEIPTHYDAAIYENTVPDILRAIATAPDSASALLVVGHFPGLPALAVHLDPSATITEFKTSAYARLTTTDPFSDLLSARLVAHRTPR